MNASPSESDRLAIAAHLHVLLRRKLGRVTDTEWMASDASYAQEIVRLCRAQADTELQAWADKLERAVPGARPKPPAVEEGPREAPAAPSALAHRRAAPIEQRYVGRLR